MFVIELFYKADLAAIDAQMKPHMAYINKHYADGTFVLSGRKVPRDGGVILANGNDRDAIEAIVKQDPFIALGLADYKLVQFRCSTRADDVPKRFE